MHRTNRLWLPDYCSPDGLLPKVQETRSLFAKRPYTFPDFVQALAFTNKVGELAEAQGHHPDILLKWGEVRISIWTHKIDGLTESDFIFAAKTDRL